MRLLWLTNGDTSVCEDYLLAGLARTGHEVEVRPWKRTFDETRDPERHGGHGYTLRLGGELPRVEVGRPEIVIVSRAWRDREAVERALDGHPGVPVVFFDGEDKHHPPPDWLDARCARWFVSHCPPALAGGRVVPLPPCARADLLPDPADDKPFVVVYGGKIAAGHGERHRLVGPAITAGLIDNVYTYSSWATWTDALRRARFSISIGGAQNHPVAGANVSLFEAGCCGAGVIAFPPGIVIAPALPVARFFETPQALQEACSDARQGRLQLADLAELRTPRDLAAYLHAHHSHTARAAQFVERLREVA